MIGIFEDAWVSEQCVFAFGKDERTAESTVQTRKARRDRTVEVNVDVKRFWRWILSPSLVSSTTTFSSVLSLPRLVTKAPVCLPLSVWILFLHCYLKWSLSREVGCSWMVAADARWCDFLTQEMQHRRFTVITVVRFTWRIVHCTANHQLRASSVCSWSFPRSE